MHELDFYCKYRFTQKKEKRKKIHKIMFYFVVKPEAHLSLYHFTLLCILFLFSKFENLFIHIPIVKQCPLESVNIDFKSTP